MWFSNGNDIYKQEQPKKQQQQQKHSGGKNIEDYKNRAFINEFEQKPIKNELVEVIEVLDDANANVNEKTNKEKISNEIQVNDENELNSFVKKVKPMNEVKKKILNEREKRKHEKLMKKKKDLEDQLKKNTEQYNLLKPVFKKKKLSFK